jgi:DUF1680 family protein
MTDEMVTYHLDRKQITLCDPFWSRYEGLILKVKIPYLWDALNDKVDSTEPSHAIKNFKIAAGIEEWEFNGLVFQNSDVYKWLEGGKLKP